MLPFPHEKQRMLKDLCTFGVGGPARFYTVVRQKEEMAQVISHCFQTRVRYFILGKGSNCLFADEGFDGLVIHSKIDFLTRKEQFFTAGSGYSFARIGSLTSREGWTGLEFASGIPATVGGAIYMNAGANGRETADVLTEVKWVSERGELQALTRKELVFSYRQSPFQQMKGAIVEATFELTATPEAKVKQKAILDYRLKTQPYGEKSAGCAFRNPPENPAGKLIEQAGLKGLKVGDAEVSNLHANFIINRGNATAEEILALLQLVKEKVLERVGISLEEEIRKVPYSDLS